MYREKYLKYKLKYNQLKKDLDNQYKIGGSISNEQYLMQYDVSGNMIMNQDDEYDVSGNMIMNQDDEYDVSGNMIMNQDDEYNVSGNIIPDLSFFNWF